MLENKTQKRMATLLFSLCWVIYFISYLGRRNLSAAMSSMIHSGVLTTAQAGAINTAFFITYAVGQLINGILADRLKPSRMIFMGILLAGVSNTAMIFAPNDRVMILLWALNGYAMAMLWPPMLRIFTLFLNEASCVRASVHIATSPVAGAIASYLLYALLLSIWDWQSTFLLAAVLLLLAAFFWLWGYARAERRLSPVEKPSKDHTGDGLMQKLTFRELALFVFLPVLLPVLIQGILRDGVSTWVPTYLTETFLLSPDFAVGMSVLLPIVNLAGPYLAHFLYRRFLKNEILCAGFFFLLATIFLGAFLLWGQTSAFLGLLFFAGITTSMEGVNLLLVSILPLRFARFGVPATLSGFMNFLTYLGSAISTFGIGALVHRFGWSVALPVWCVCAAVGLLACLFIRKISVPSK